MLSLLLSYSEGNKGGRGKIEEERLEKVGIVWKFNITGHRSLVHITV